MYIGLNGNKNFIVKKKIFLYSSVQHYSSEQIMSIHSFSCLRSWIEEVHKQTKQIHDNDHDTANDRSSSDDSHDESTNGEPDNQSLGGTSFISQSGDMSVYLSLDRDNFCDKMVDYCIRVIDQCSLSKLTFVFSLIFVFWFSLCIPYST